MTRSSTIRALRLIPAMAILALIALPGCERRVTETEWRPVYGSAAEARDNERQSNDPLLPLPNPLSGEDAEADSEQANRNPLESIGAFLFGDADRGETEHPAVQRLPNQINDRLPHRDPDWPPNDGE